jgi:hypothetical protein
MRKFLGDIDGLIMHRYPPEINYHSSTYLSKAPIQRESGASRVALLVATY